MMPALRTLYRYRLHAVRKAAKEANWVQVAVAALFILLASAVIAASYFLFSRGFSFMLDDALAGPLIVRYVLEVSFALVFLLGTVSFVVSSFGMFFRNREVRLLGAMPVPPLTLFLYSFSGVLLLSSWPAFFLAAPALAALGVTLGAGFGYYFICLLVLALFIFSIALAGSILSFLLAPLVRRVPLGWLALLEGIAFAVIALAVIRRIVPRSVFGMFDVSTAAAASVAEARLEAMFAWLPSHYFVRLIAAVLPFGSAASLADAAALFASVAASFLLLLAIARRWYFSLWQSHHATGFLARPEDAPEGRPRRPFPRLLRWKHGFLFEKEVLMLVRSPGDISRACFLLMLLVVYVLAARAISLMGAFSNVNLYAWVVAFAFASIGYFALTFGLRFVFPSPSLEGKSAWVLWSSPVHAHESHSWKFFFWTALLLVVLESVSTLISILFGLPFPLGQFLSFAVFLTTVSVVAITLGQGTMFPDFHQPDPDMLTTSPAGLAATALGLLFVWVMTRYVHQFTLTFLESGQVDTLAMFGMLVVALAVTGAYWALSVRAAEKTEVV